MKSGEVHAHATDSLEDIPIIRGFSRGPAKLDSVLFVITGLWHLLLHGRGDIYHAHDVGAPGWLAVIASYLLRGKCILKMRSGRHSYRARYPSRLNRAQLSLLLRLADKVHVVSKELEQYVHSLGVRPSRIALIHNSVEIDQFHPPSIEERKSARARLGLSYSKHVVLFVGRLEPVKGVDLLLRAWALLPNAVLEKSLLILMGSGSAGPSLKNMIKSLDIRETVLMPGATTNVLTYYWAANIFVLPSRSEGMSNSLAEAMACGLPVLASRIGGALDLVKEGQNGITFEPGNFRQLEGQLRLMLTSSQTWNEVGSCARKTAIATVSKQTALTKFIELYGQLSFSSRKR